MLQGPKVPCVYIDPLPTTAFTLAVRVGLGPFEEPAPLVPKLVKIGSNFAGSDHECANALWGLRHAGEQDAARFIVHSFH